MTIYDVWFTIAIGTNCPNGEKIASLGLTTQQVYESRMSLNGKIFSPKQIQRASATTLEMAESAYKSYVDYGVKSVTYADADFPQCFTGFAHMPLVLYYKGDLSLLNSQYVVSIVGSRQCSGDGERACQIIAGDIAKMGGVVASGLAQGVDSIAHRTATDNGGRTVAFLGTPLTYYYPKINEDYQKYLERTNLVVTEYTHNTEYYASNFVSRNRLIAAAGRAVCVIQATAKSGSMATVNRAKEMGKQIFAVPGGIFQDSYRGSNALLYDGTAQAVKDGMAIMHYLGAEDAPAPKQTKIKEMLFLDLSDNAQQVLAVLDGAMFSSQIIKATGLSAAAAMAALTELEMEDAVIKTDSGEYIRQK